MTEWSRGTADGELIARDGDRVERLFAISAQGKTWVFHDGVTYEIVDEAPARRRSGGHESLTSPMPATIIKINVNVGDAVKNGDILLLLEAMKMELPVRAPADGRVTAINCRAGELVQPGVSLLDIE